MHRVEIQMPMHPEAHAGNRSKNKSCRILTEIYVAPNFFIKFSCIKFNGNLFSQSQIVVSINTGGQMKQS